MFTYADQAELFGGNEHVEARTVWQALEASQECSSSVDFQLAVGQGADPWVGTAEFPCVRDREGDAFKHGMDARAAGLAERIDVDARRLQLPGKAQGWADAQRCGPTTLRTTRVGTKAAQSVPRVDPPLDPCQRRLIPLGTMGARYRTLRLKLVWLSTARTAQADDSWVSHEPPD